LNLKEWIEREYGINKNEQIILLQEGDALKNEVKIYDIKASFFK
jgi:hypothetical protein